MIRLLIVDDHDIVRTGLRRILERESDFEIAGEAADGDSALRAVREHDPDVVLLDVNMPGMGGVETTRRILQGSSPPQVIILTVHARAPFPTRLLDAGAAGYLTKGCAAAELTGAIRAVAQGQRYVGTDIAQQLALSLLPGNDGSPFDRLSERELEITMMLTQGHELQYIAGQLALSPKTISTYKARLYDKLEVQNEVELTHLAMRHGIVDPSSPAA